VVVIDHGEYGDAEVNAAIDFSNREQSGPRPDAAFCLGLASQDFLHLCISFIHFLGTLIDSYVSQLIFCCCKYYKREPFVLVRLMAEMQANG
jgi:hypothetical protein